MYAYGKSLSDLIRRVFGLCFALKKKLFQVRFYGGGDWYG